MGFDAFEVHETPFHPSCVKVHLAMCTELLRLVDRISNISPDIEAAQPRCSSGIEALCLLQNAIGKARILVQNCCQSSKLYLALTGETVVSRFQRTRSLLQQSLHQLQNMVPVALGFEISELLDDLREAVFFMDVHEEEAGKALRTLLEQGTANSVGNSEIEVLQFAASRLHLTSQKDILIERRSIRKLLDEVKEGNSTKRTTLKYLLHLLKKYDKLIVQGKTTRNPSTPKDGSFLLVNCNSMSVTKNSANLKTRPTYVRNDARASPIIPEEYKCPLSSRLMYDPVIISSGQTFERSSIQTWFEKGHDTCPITKLKLVDLSVTPNTVMRELILKWSMEHKIIDLDSRIQFSVFGSLENSSNSIASNASSMKDLHLQLDMSNISLGSVDSNYGSDFSSAKVDNSFDYVKEPSADVDSHRFQFYHSIDEIKRQFLSNISEFPWESQCRAVQDVNDYLIYYNPSCAFVSSENFVEPLAQFLKDALDKHDGDAQKAGSQLLLTFSRASRETAHISEDVYTLLASFLGTEAAPETLAIMEVLSAQESSFPDIAASGALTSLVEFLNTGHKRDFQEAVIRILYNLSLIITNRSCKLASDWIPKLVPFLEDSAIAGTCLSILENLCKFEETRVRMAETDGCIAAMVELLETGSSEDQEIAVGILLSLCAQHDYYCYLVLHEGVVPALCHVSINGNEKAKVSASELLRVLRDIRYEEDEEENPTLNSDPPDSQPKNIKEEKSYKSKGSFAIKMMKFLRKN